jgi:hypothetical protein
VRTVLRELAGVLAVVCLVLCAIALRTALSILIWLWAHVDG